VRHLLLLALLLTGAPALAEDARTAADGIYSEAQAARGLAVYDAHCMVCHASGMTGGAGSPPLVGRAFLIGWRTETVGALLEQLRATMPTGQAGSLSDQQYADVLSAMLKANGFPPSSDGAELAADPAALEGVTLGAPE
jgi:mono/diheme cytochrome c family protein